MSAAKAVTDESFDADVLASPRPVIVEYWAPWCGPCRMVSPVLDEIAAEYAGSVVVVKVNTDENPQSMIKYGVLAVPTINLFSGGQVVKQIVGAKPMQLFGRRQQHLIAKRRELGRTESLADLRRLHLCRVRRVRKVHPPDLNKMHERGLLHL